jgi:uncharacterized protein YndB with AHSA1/START domain
MTAPEPLIEVTLPAPVEEVWAHLRDPRLIPRWFGWDYEGLEAEIEFIFLGPPPEALAGMPEGAGFEVDDGAHTITWAYGGADQDRFELRAEGDGCVLRVTRTISPESWDGVYDDMGEGWISFVQQLRFALTWHRGEERRTVFTSSSVAATDDVLAVLGVDRVDGPWAGMLGPEPGRSGDLWFRSDHQLAVTVDQWNDGLLLVTWPRDTASVTLSVFGLDDAAVVDLTERWTAWWTGHVGTPDPDSPYA